MMRGRPPYQQVVVALDDLCDAAFDIHTSERLAAAREKAEPLVRAALSGRTLTPVTKLALAMTIVWFSVMGIMGLFLWWTVTS